MVIPGPSFVPLVRTENIDDVFSGFSGVHNVVGGVAVYGSAAAYALVWELGNRRQKTPGPKTRWGINRNDERVILTSQAPYGYVGIGSFAFWKIIEEEIGAVSFSSGSAAEINVRLSVAIDNASQRIAQIIKSFAPVDKGDLVSQIQMVDSDESELLSSSNASSDATLIL